MLIVLLFYQHSIQDKEEKEKSKHVKAETAEKDKKLVGSIEDLSSAVHGKKVDVDTDSLGDFSDDNKKLKQSDVSISSRSSIDSNMSKPVRI